MIFARREREPEQELEVVWSQSRQTAFDKSMQMEPTADSRYQKHEDRHQKILTAMQYFRSTGVPYVTAQDITDMTGIPGDQVNHSLYTLISRHQVERLLPVDGRRWLNRQIYALTSTR